MILPISWDNCTSPNAPREDLSVRISCSATTFSDNEVIFSWAWSIKLKRLMTLWNTSWFFSKLVWSFWVTSLEISWSLVWTISERFLWFVADCSCWCFSVWRSVSRISALPVFVVLKSGQRKTHFEIEYVWLMSQRVAVSVLLALHLDYGVV